ncbi:MAG: hypothetical protein WC655_15700 [Candidatus Hydrogenedentales bacterium]|jgi:hypothetical protein
MSDEQGIEAGPVFKDRSTGLIVFGILQIALGALCVLVLVLMALGIAATRAMNETGPAAMSWQMMVPGLFLYGAMGAWFITMGIGSVMARRWARALTLISSAIWLMGGVSGLVVMLVFMPDVYAQMGEKGQIPPEMAVVMKYVMAGSLLVFGVFLPGMLLLFYGRKNVKATCEFRDPNVRWTDACPLPVLAVSLLCCAMSLSMLTTGSYGWALPFFGRVVSGATGAAVAISVAVVFMCLAWGMYRLRAAAWWGMLAMIVVWGVSTMLTFSRTGMSDFYKAMNLPPEQLEIVNQTGFAQSPWFAVYCGVWIAVFIGYLMYIRKYFKAPKSV